MVGWTASNFFSFVSICLSIYLYLSIYLSIYLSVCLSILSPWYNHNGWLGVKTAFLPIYLSICLSVCLVCLPACLPACLSVRLSVSFKNVVCVHPEMESTVCQVKLIEYARQVSQMHNHGQWQDPRVLNETKLINSPNKTNERKKQSPSRQSEVIYDRDCFCVGEHAAPSCR